MSNRGTHYAHTGTGESVGTSPTLRERYRDAPAFRAVFEPVQFVVQIETSVGIVDCGDCASYWGSPRSVRLVRVGADFRFEHLGDLTVVSAPHHKRGVH